MAGEKYGKKWSEDETILAFYYYCQIPFGKIHKTNPEIMHIASILGRTPSSVVLKMGNLITVLPDFTVRVSSIVTSCANSDGAAFLVKYDKQAIALPEKFTPNREYLEYHNDVVFSP